MRNLLKWLGVRRKGVGGREPFDLRPSLLFVRLDVVELAEFVVCVDSSERDLCNALVGGVARTGVKALRKSVYAVGGVMGVFSPCSCLITAERQADRGVSTISDGNEAVFGV